MEANAFLDSTIRRSGPGDEYDLAGQSPREIAKD